MLESGDKLSIKRIKTRVVQATRRKHRSFGLGLRNADARHEDPKPVKSSRTIRQMKDDDSEETKYQKQRLSVLEGLREMRRRHFTRSREEGLQTEENEQETSTFNSQIEPSCCCSSSSKSQSKPRNFDSQHKKQSIRQNRLKTASVSSLQSFGSMTDSRRVNPSTPLKAETVRKSLSRRTTSDDLGDFLDFGRRVDTDFTTSYFGSSLGLSAPDFSATKARLCTDSGIFHDHHSDDDDEELSEILPIEAREDSVESIAGDLSDLDSPMIHKEATHSSSLSTNASTLPSALVSVDSTLLKTPMPPTYQPGSEAKSFRGFYKRRYQNQRGASCASLTSMISKSSVRSSVDFSSTKKSWNSNVAARSEKEIGLYGVELAGRADSSSETVLRDMINKIRSGQDHKIADEDLDKSDLTQRPKSRSRSRYWQMIHGLSSA